MAAGFIGVEKSDKRSSVAPGTPPIVDRKPTVRVVAKAASATGGKHTVLVSTGPGEVLDVTSALTASLAHALWQLRGGVEVSNWVDGEALLDRLLSPADATVGVPHASPEVIVPGKRTAARR